MPHAQDPFHFSSDDLADIDLSKINLDDLDLPPTRPSAWRRWLAALTLTGLGALVLYIPSTEYYLRYGQSNGAFFAVCIAGLLVGGLLGRLVLRWAQETADTWVARAERRAHKTAEDDTPASPWVRYSVLTLVLGSAALLLFALPQTVYNPRGGFQGLWFAASAAAFVVGILAGRWLLMQATARAAVDTRPPKPMVLPPWLKWVTLALLIALALLAIFGMSLFGGTGNDKALEFTLGAVGFVVGVGGAIWMARRFEDLESAAQKKRGKP